MAVQANHFRFPLAGLSFRPMRLGFTETLSAALLNADQEARDLGHDFVGTEHLLMGIILGRSGDAFRALQAQSNVDRLLPRLTRAMPEGGETPRVSGPLPLSPKAQRVLNTASSQAQAAGQPNVSTRFVLLAMLGDEQLAIGRLIAETGANLQELRGLLDRGDDAGET